MNLFSTCFNNIQDAVKLSSNQRPLLTWPGKNALVLVLLLLSFTANAQTPDANGIIYVTPNGTGDGHDWDNATANLQGAINSGATKVFVAVGEYMVPSPHSFVMKDGVAIYGGFDPGAGITDLDDARILPNHGASEGSVLNGKNERPVIWNEGNELTSSAILDGFTIKNGYSTSDGGGIYNKKSTGTSSMYPNFFNLVIKNNTADWEGGGMYNKWADVHVYNTIFTENKARKGGAISDNYAYGTLVNVLITGNTAIENGGGVYTDGWSTTLINSTLVNNTSVYNTSNEAYSYSGSTIVRNSIIYGQKVGNFTTSTSIVTNTGADEIFNDPFGGDFRLKSSSVAINAGNNTFNATPLDLEGNPRINNGTIDIGAYEYSSSVPPVVITPDANKIVYVRKGATGDGSSWLNATANLQGAINADGAEKVFVAVGTYYLPPLGGSFKLKNGVAVYGGFDPDYGIDDLSKVRILPDPANSTLGSILNGNGSRTVIANVFTQGSPLNQSAILDGFTITGGSTTTDGGGIYNEYASPTLTNLVFRNNKAVFGGGVFNRNSSPEMSHITLMNNQVSKDGGGIYNKQSSPLMVDIKITDNKANYGGGVFNQTSAFPQMVNVLIAGNSSNNDAGGMYNDASSLPVLINTTLAGNTGLNAIYNRNASVSVNNSVVYGGIAGNAYTAQYSLIEGNTDFSNSNLDASIITPADLFMDYLNGNYNLKLGSPAIDKGSNALYPELDANTKDLAGNARLAGATINLGAYESADGTLPVVFGSFSAYIKDGRLVINWRTLTETNNDHFLIQLSRDGVNFKTIQTVQSKAEDGNSSTALDYSSAIPFTTLSLGAGFLLLGVMADHRRRYAFATVTIVLAVFLFSCSKKDMFKSIEDGRLFVRIVQVDKDGTESASKAIRVVSE
ncbi:MAG: choice-of-anchor Q domain-containing protein [Niabella sp.]